MTNPFVYEEFAVGGHFCGREPEIETFLNYAEDGKNILLYSRRRYGKSSLVKEIFENHLDPKKYLLVYVDLFEILDEEDFARLFYAQTAKGMRLTLKSALNSLVKYFRKVRFSIDIGPDGTPGFTPTLAGRSFDELVEDLFEGIAQYTREKGLKAVIAFDEFQQIAAVRGKRIDAVIRKHIQSHGHICYVFSGSKKHLLTGLFNDYKAPLYAMASGMELEGIDIPSFYAFANRGLKGRLPREEFERIYRIADGESKLIQHVCYHLYGARTAIRREQVDKALEKILKESDGEHRMLFDRLTLPQKTVLKGIALSNGENLFAKETLARLNVTKASMAAAVKILMEQEVIDREEGRYFINGRKFELWCRWQLGGIAGFD